MYLYLEIGSVKKQLTLNDVNRVGSYPVGLVSLKEEEEASGVCLQRGKAM